MPHVTAVEARSGLAFARHTHDEYGIGRIVSGAQRSWSGLGAVEAGPGDLITVNPGEVHDGAPIGPARTWRMLYFAPPVLADLARDVADGAQAEFEFTAPVIGNSARNRAFDAAYDAVAGDREERLLILLAGLVRAGQHSSPPDHPGMKRARALVDDDPAAALTLSDLASVAEVSRFQLIRGFSRLTGLTPHAYIVQRRLNAARQMIGRGAALADAAAACGFADQSHFTREFSRRYGLTPGAYAAAAR
jgi:AraC-like DNA-binding protein